MEKLNLKYFDLTDNEANIYMELLENSPQTVIELSKKLKISRTGLYKILKNLIDAKLVFDKNKMYYSKSPKILYSKLKNEEKLIQNQKKIIEYLIENGKIPKIKAFYGSNGYKELNNELKKNPVQKGYMIFNSDFIPKDLESRKSKEKFIDDIVVNFTNKKKRKSKRNEKQFSYKYQNSFSAISIFGDKIAIYSKSKAISSNYGLLIIDQNIANLLKDLVDKIMIVE